ncbi:cytochrome P450 [Ceratobasidium sp. AG-I]|nr:cytochrome P450 [Ceratobasidium sp. AG-I]
MVVSSAAFGQRLIWIENAEKPDPGVDVSFHKAILMVSQTTVRRQLTPSWAENWTKANRDMVFGFTELKRYLRSMITAYRDEGGAVEKSADEGSSTDNLFSVLMKASQEDRAEKGKGLSDEAITGNIFLFLIGNHERCTPKYSKKPIRKVKQAVTPDSALTYASLKDLKLVAGTLYGALRMYPPVLQVTRIAEEDATISVARNTPGTDEHMREDVFIPTNSFFIMSVIGTHYDPKYWPEPEEFRPSRFSKPYNKYAFLAWSTDHRACIGQKFAESKATILARFEITVDEYMFPAIPGESINARRERLLRPTLLMTLAPEKLPLMFTHC